MERIKDVVRAKEIIGRILLTKNEKIIRDKYFSTRYQRRVLHKEYNDIAILDNYNQYHVIIKLS